MRRNPIDLAILMASTLLAFAVPPAWGNAAVPEAASAGNGYILMIHSTFEPDGYPHVDGADTGSRMANQSREGIEYAPGAVVTTRDGDFLVIRAIPYLAATAYPVVVTQPQLQVDELGGGRRLMLQPSRPADNDSICRLETGWRDHEGPLEACSVYRVPVHEFDGMHVVTLTLRFLDARGSQEEAHNVPAHNMLHNVILGAPVDLKTVEAASTEPTPFVIEDVIDTQRPVAWHCAIASV